MRKIFVNILVLGVISGLLFPVGIVSQSAADKMKDAAKAGADAMKDATDKVNPEDEPKASVRGRVFYEETGQPLRRAWIGLVKIRNMPGGTADANEPAVSGDWEFQNADAVLTSDFGEFVIKDVTPGVYQAVLKVPGILNPMMTDVNSTVFQQFTFDGLTEAQIEVGVKRGGAVSGFVRYQDGAPLIGAAVVLLKVTGTEENGEPKVEELTGLSEAVTDDRGYYRFAGLPQGDYVIKTSEPSVFDGSNARVSSYSTDRYFESSELQTFFPSGRNLGEASRVQVMRGEEIQDIDVTLAHRELYEVSGRVVGAKDNALIDGIELEFKKADEEENEDYQVKAIRTTTTDSEGRWKFKDMVPGKYEAVISEPDYRRYEGEDSQPTRPNYATSIHPFEITVGENRDVIFRLAVEGSIEGLVSVEGGQLLPGQVEIFANTKTESVSCDSVETTDYESTEMQQKLRGEFQIEDLKEGEYFLNVRSSEGFFAKSITYKGANILDKPLTVKAGQKIEGIRVVLGTGTGTVSGNVIESDSDEYYYAYLMPINPGKTLYQAFLESETDYVGTSGSFEIQARPGEYYLFAYGSDIGKPKSNASAEEKEAWVNELIKNARRINLVRGGTVQADLNIVK